MFSILYYPVLSCPVHSRPNPHPHPDPDPHPLLPYPKFEYLCRQQKSDHGLMIKYTTFRTKFSWFGHHSAIFPAHIQVTMLIKEGPPI